jgi:hypothetical protein
VAAESLAAASERLRQLDASEPLCGQMDPCGPPLYLPPIIRGRIIWHLGFTKDARAAAYTQSSGELQHAASEQEPSYRVWGLLTDGFDSPRKSRRTLCPGARRGNGLRPAIHKLPKPLATLASPVRQALRAQLHPAWLRAQQRKGLPVFALGYWHAGGCGVEVEGGRVPTRGWFLNPQILTSGGVR